MALVPFVSPIPGAVVTSGWGDPRSGHTHQGLDFRASIGTPVRAVAGGQVVMSKDDSAGGGGRTIWVRHPGGWTSRYFHLDERFVSLNQFVAVGQVIGRSGATGIKQSAAHLHFDLLTDPVNLSEAAPYTGGRTGASYGDHGVAVPSEPFVPAGYTERVLGRIQSLGFQVFQSPVARIGIGAVLGIAVVGGAIWWAWRQRRPRPAGRQ